MKSESRMFIHGFLGSKKCCPINQCTAIELPGHGNTKFTKGLSFNSYVDSLLATIKKPTHLIGYSMGGRIAMKMAIKCPDLFSQITIISAHPGKHGNESQIIQKLRSLCLEDFIRWWYSQNLFRGTDIESRIKATKNQNARELSLCLECFSKKKQGSLWNELGPISHKLHYICGELDKKYVCNATKLKRLYPLIRTTIIANGSHNVCSNLKHLPL